jgi:arylsulfatase A-like enzyme
LCADHGEEFFEHGGLFHSSKLDDEVLRVPLLTHLPEQNSCQFVSQRIGLIDFLPTIAEYIGIDFDPNIYEGLSFEKILNGSSHQERDERILAAEVFYDENNISIGFNPYDTCGVPRRLCLHNGKFKFVADCTRQNLKIYNVETDPLERNDLSKTHPELRRVAEAMVREYLRRSERRRLAFVRRKFPHLEPDSFLESR